MAAGLNMQSGIATLADAATAELRERILTGELESGAPLRLEELARSLGTSISPIREAVRKLEALGLAVHVPHRGSRVKELDVVDLRDTYEARLALEGMAVERAAERITDAEIAQARRALENFTVLFERGDRAGARAAHDDFHFTLYSASGSDWLVRLIRPAWENSERYRALSTHVRTREREHLRILKACAAGDGHLAAEELRQHLSTTANLVANQLGSPAIFPSGALGATDGVPIAAGHFRQLLGHFATGVVVVTAIDDGRPVGLTCNSFTSVSLEPPLVSFCPSKSSATWRSMREHGTFCLNVLSEHQESLSRQFAQRGDDRFATVAWAPASSGAPALAEALAWIECELVAEHDGGDHTIAVARVTALRAASDGQAPLVFYRGQYAGLGERTGHVSTLNAASVPPASPAAE